MGPVALLLAFSVPPPPYYLTHAQRLVWARHLLIALGVLCAVAVAGTWIGVSFRRWQWKRYVRRKYGDQANPD